ncbi:putative Cell division cycle protein 27 like protein [Blattamonas nauphoetae]|uniref:Cell division cycle protein 27 like protein n=1 Tax=Blattamonas nauphoetae TaxID=2049346 RepID=A0ABQ9YG29_9EUKA|nr:putative Cell division cycle protein 27 like protein [Blattamonas nauphoetae]
MVTNTPFHTDGLDLYSSVLHTTGRSNDLHSLSVLIATMYPDSYESLVVAGNYYSIINHQKKALLCFQRACQQFPLRAYPYSLAGHECCELGQYSLALALYRHSYTLNPNSTVALLGMGITYHHLQRFGLAETHIRLAHTLNPHSVPILYRLAIVITQGMNGSERVQESIDLFDEALRLSPRNLLMRTRRASLLMTIPDRIEEAVKELLGKAQLSLDKPFDAYFAFEKASQISPTDDMFRTTALRGLIPNDNTITFEVYLQRGVRQEYDTSYLQATEALSSNISTRVGGNNHSLDEAIVQSATSYDSLNKFLRILIRQVFSTLETLKLVSLRWNTTDQTAETIIKDFQKARQKEAQKKSNGGEHVNTDLTVYDWITLSTTHGVMSDQIENATKHLIPNNSNTELTQMKEKRQSQKEVEHRHVR